MIIEVIYYELGNGIGDRVKLACFGEIAKISANDVILHQDDVLGASS